LKAEIPPGLPDDPECEGFPQNLRTSAEKGNSHKDITPKATSGESATPEKPVAKPSKTACPKNLQYGVKSTLDKSQIQVALKLKGFRGSVVMEKICCGKPGCRCQTGRLHGPYPYLHFYEAGRVRRRYLKKTMRALLANSREELEKMLTQGSCE
jgi:hypothetical protein